MSLVIITLSLSFTLHFALPSKSVSHAPYGVPYKEDPSPIMPYTPEIHETPPYGDYLLLLGSAKNDTVLG